MNFTAVAGKDRGNIKLFALSTCGWCRKTKTLLGELGVRYAYIDVDLLGEMERDDLFAELEKWDPMRSFPLIVIDNNSSIVGFDEKKIRSILSGD
jgi:glutaredoxin-like protein NrdH